MAGRKRLLGRLGWLVAVFVMAYLGGTLGWLGTREVRASHNFGDVPDNAFYHAFVQFLGDNGITSGCGPGRFCGEDAVTRGQMAVFLKKLFDLVDLRLAEVEGNQSVIVRTRLGASASTSWERRSSRRRTFQPGATS